MERNEFNEGLRKLTEGSFGLILNASDTFYYACAQSVNCYPEDLLWVVPIFAKYGWDGETACMAYILGECPIPPLRTKKYWDALLEIIALAPEVHSEN